MVYTVRHYSTTIGKLTLADAQVLLLLFALLQCQADLLLTVSTYPDANKRCVANASAEVGIIATSSTVVKATALSTSTTCFTMLGLRDYSIWRKETYTCGEEQITSVGEWCAGEGCTECEGTVNCMSSTCDYRQLSNYTWNTSSYLSMQDGNCAAATVDEYVLNYENDQLEKKHKNINMLHVSASTWNYPCSYLSTAPTPAPTPAPTAAAGSEMSSVLLALLAAGGTLLSVGAVVLIVWRYITRPKMEPWRKAMYHSAKEKCNGDSEWAHERVASEGLGVSAAYIVSDFHQEAQAAARVAEQRDSEPGSAPRQFPLDTNNPVFHDIAPVMCYGEAAKGFGMQCPRDRQPNCAVVDALHSAGKAGQSTQFLSWVWSYKTGMFTSTIRAWVKTDSRVLEETFIWVCFFW